MPNSIVFSNPGASLVQWGDGAATPYLTLSGIPSSVTVGVAVTGIVTNAGTVSHTWAVNTSPADTIVSPSSGTLDAGENVSFTVTALASGTKNILLTSSTPGATINGSPMTFVASSGATPPADEPPTSGGVTVTTLSGGSAGLQPFAFGQVFAEGDIPSGSQLDGAQINALTAWPDGSVKTAIVSGYATITAATDRPVALAVGTSPTGTDVATSALAAVTALHDCGTFGTVSWGSADWATPHVTVCTGPVMSSWLYRKAVGSDAHLVAWLEIRAFSGGEVQVLPWVENGYLAVASPTNKAATYGFSLNGTTKCSAVYIDLKHHQRTPLINGASLWYWADTDPGIVPIHDAAYLQSTELVPSYYSSLTAGHARVTAQPTTFVPLQQGSFDYSSDAMTSSGYQRPIGLLPEHDVLHLVANDDDRATTFKSVVRNGYSAGRYSIHYRDETTNRPLRFSSYATKVAEQSNSGFAGSALGASSASNYCPTPLTAAGPVYDPAHAPALGYMAHLLTGFWYFMEEVQFQATAEFLCKTDTAIMRNGSNNLVQTAVDAWQTRASAWQFRTLANALCITPTADTDLRAEFLASVHANVDNLWGTYVNQSNNSFGIVLPGETYSSSISKLAIWQQDMVTAAWGYAKSLGLPLDATRTTRLGLFFDWKAQSIVGRMGTSGTFPFENANRYQLELGTSLSTSGYTAGTGPWPASWAAIYSTTTPLASSPDNPLATAGGNVLATEYDSSSAAKGQWGTLQQAIAYAVRHGVSGASAAYNRMIGATNWASMLTANFAASYPVMGVKPYFDPVATPAWASAVAVGQIKAVGGSGAGGASVDAFCGWAYKPDSNEIFIAAAGGHNDSSDNRVVSCDLTAATLSWTLRKASTGSNSVLDNPYQADGTPSSRHNYEETRWVAALSRVMLIGCYAPFGPGVTQGYKVDGFNPTTNTWDAAGTWPDTPAGYYGRAQEGTGDVWALSGPSLARKFSATTGTWSTPSMTFSGQFVRFPWAWTGSYLFGLSWNDGQGFTPPTGLQCMKQVGTVQTAITFNSSSAYTQFQSDAPQYAGMDYCTTDSKFYFYDGRGSAAGRIFTITPNVGTTWDMGTFTAGSGSDTLPATISAGLNNRWTFVTVGTAKGFLFMPSASAGLYFLRTE